MGLASAHMTVATPHEEQGSTLAGTTAATSSARITYKDASHSTSCADAAQSDTLRPSSPYDTITLTTMSKPTDTTPPRGPAITRTRAKWPSVDVGLKGHTLLAAVTACSALGFMLVGYDNGEYMRPIIRH